MIRHNGAIVTDRKSDWLERAVISGFVGTALMTSVLAVAYGIAIVLGSNSPGAPLIVQWLWGLGHNAVTEQAQTALPAVVLLHFVFGLIWAVLYAAVVEPRLPGPGWQRGLLFAPIPGALSLLVFLPAVGGGLLGLSLGAGPLPLVGNLVLHLVYGITLGHFYPPSSSRALIERGEIESAEETMILAHAGHALALGLILGFGLGGILGWIGQVVIAPSQPIFVALVLGAIGGSAVGALVGSFAGLSPQHH